MLQSVRAGSVPLAQGAFLDQLNKEVYFLAQGQLKVYNTVTQT
jgi:hypothetical protein